MRRVWKGYEKLSNYRVLSECRGVVCAGRETNNYEEAMDLFHKYVEAYRKARIDEPFKITMYNNNVEVTNAYIYNF